MIRAPGRPPPSMAHTGSGGLPGMRKCNTDDAMRVILTSLGHAGDVYPFFALALALKRRGHRAALLLNPRFRQTAETLGLEFHALRPPGGTRGGAQAGIQRPGIGMWRLWSEVVLPNVPVLVDALNELTRAERPDWVVYHPASIGTPWVCRARGIRSAAATLVPKAWLEYNRGDVHGVAGPDETPAEQRVRRMLRFARPAARFFSDRALNRIRRDLGFPPMRNVFCRQFLDCDLNLGLWSRALRGPLPSDPAPGEICGFTWFDGLDRPAPADAALQQYLASGPPPIVFTLGTVIVSTAGNFYEMAAEACGRIGRRGLLLTGAAENAPRRLPEGVRAFDYVPLSCVLPHGCLTVHHGGIGTTGQALRAGRPMLIIPFVRDQFDSARMAGRLRTSLTLDRRRITVRTLASHLQRLLDRDSVRERAARIGRRMMLEDGAERAATLLEE